MNVIKGYSYDDLLLIPKKSDIKSRADVDISVDLGKGIKLKNPIISANMASVSGPEMCAKLADLGAIGILHRFTEDRIGDYKKAIYYNDPPVTNNRWNHIGVSVGLDDSEFDFLEEIIEKIGCKIICVDVAHGHHDRCLNQVEFIAKKFSNCLLIAGNVATFDGAYDLWKAGADVVKCGVGNGSTCSTRIETGNGVPQMTVLCEVYSRFKKVKNPPKIISDGGMKAAGDVVKSLCFSHAVMLGNMLAGTDEAPGEKIIVDGRQYKQYAGSSTYKPRHIEGVVGLVPAKGPVENVITRILEGLRSGMSYQGARNLEELRRDPKFVEITNSGLIESRPHDILIK